MINLYLYYKLSHLSRLASTLMHQHPSPPPSHQDTLHRRLRVSIAVLTAIICSLNIRATTIETLRNSRDLSRSLNKAILQHDDLDIYWFGYRAGQYLINYPTHEYY